MGRINLPQTATPSTPSASTANLFVNTSGVLCVHLPNGTVYPVAMRNTAQTFSEAQTFSSVITSPGTKPASDGTAAIRLFKADGTTAVLTVDTTNSRVIAAGDVFANADTSGLMTRLVNAHQTPTDHFTATTLAGAWSWVSSPFADAPDNVNLTAIPSLLRVHDSVLTDDFFLAQTASASVFGRVFVSGNSYVGVRLDDGSANNSIEVRVQGSATGLVSVTALLVNGGGAPTSTTLLSNILAQWLTVLVARSGSTVRTYWGVNGPVPAYAYGASSQTWTAARGGIVFGQRETASSADLRAGYIDWVAIS